MNLKDYQRGRNDGLALALKIVQEGGREALEAEIKNRGVAGISVNLTQKELTLELEAIKELTVRTMLALSLSVLRDEHHYGKKQLQQFMDRFGEKTECLADGWVTWADICTSIQEETGIEIDFGDMFDKSKVRQEGNLS